MLCCATASPKPREGIDFLPLSVDYEEKMYAAGKIPGGYLRREGRPSEKAVLAARVIDRPIRPLFPKDLRNDVVLTLTVMSVDPVCPPEITAMIGASIALSISDIPWNGPVGGVLVGLVDGKVIIKPTYEEQKRSDLSLTVAATRKKIVMIEAGASEVDEATMFDAIMYAHKEIKDLLNFIYAIADEIGKPKFEYPTCELDPEVFEKIFSFCEQDVMFALDTDDKNVREERMLPIVDGILEKFGEEYPDLSVKLPEIIYQIQKKIVRRWLLVDKKRVDGRRMDEIRPLGASSAASEDPRLGTLHQRSNPGYHRGHARHALRGADARRHRQRDLKALYAPLQYAGLFGRRGKIKPQPQPARNRPRCAGRACAPAGAAPRGEVPLCHPPCIRRGFFKWLHLTGRGLRLDSGADGCRSTD